MRRVERCPCGHRSCKHWHVHPEAALQGVGLTERQARAVGALLDLLDEYDRVEIVGGSQSRVVVDDEGPLPEETVR